MVGQVMWGSVVRSIAPIGVNISYRDLLHNVVLAPRFWLGCVFYVLGTVCYFILLSKVKFFSIQITITALAIVFSLLVSHFVFKEDITLANIIGICIIIFGAFFVLQR